MKFECLRYVSVSFLVGLAVCTGALAEESVAIRQLGLEECISMALASAPELGEAQADINQVASKLEEASSHRNPQLEVFSLFGPAPGAKRSDLTETNAKFRFDELTWFASTDLLLIQPLYTFGKISENMKAATHGIEVERSRKQQRRNEIVLKVREYYFGVLLAREMKELLLEVQENLEKARIKAKKMIDEGSESVDQMDIFKLDAFSGEVRKYLEEASKSESLALSALRARLNLSQETPIEIPGERLAIAEEPIPEFSGYLERARQLRPEYRQIEEGLKARQALVDAARANYYPDIFLAGMVSWAYADKRDRIDNPYISDRFQHAYGGLALGARWKLDFGITGSRVAGEQAQYDRLLSTRSFAEANIPLQIKKYYLELKEADQSARASKDAYTNAKKWTVTAIANFDFGVGATRDIFEALQAYARMRAAYFQSIYNYQVARANLDYATGEQVSR